MIHYLHLRKGSEAGDRLSNKFDSALCLDRYPDVRLCLEPLGCYLHHGRLDKRWHFAPSCNISNSRMEADELRVTELAWIESGARVRFITHAALRAQDLQVGGIDSVDSLLIKEIEAISGLPLVTDLGITALSQDAQQ